ncbi:hypothetical protein Cni_G05187 [Canna indica]|uniref:Uncharacterized protein n=1 Tax=Canna indica TaxID=4628 RepID=A0AAQ3Q302_9LILI|nr:hypothetical protein Cni_G05187 [Canna indica]
MMAIQKNLFHSKQIESISYNFDIYINCKMHQFIDNENICTNPKIETLTQIIPIYSLNQISSADRTNERTDKTTISSYNPHRRCSVDARLIHGDNTLRGETAVVRQHRRRSAAAHCFHHHHHHVNQPHGGDPYRKAHLLAWSTPHGERRRLRDRSKPVGTCKCGLAC